MTGHGEVVEIDETRPELLRAAQVSVGMLGVMTSLTLEVAAAYRLSERIEHWHLDDVLARLGRAVRRPPPLLVLLAAERGLGASSTGSPTPPGQRMTDTCYVKLYDEAGDELADDATPGRRVDRSYRIYPADFEPNFHELEYFVPLERGREAVEAMRELMLASQPDAVFPLEVRTTAADEAYLSSNYRRADDRDLGLGPARATTTGPTCARSTGCSASSTRACTGASCTS